MRVLLAEDNCTISLCLIEALQESGYAVDHVSNGVDADTALFSQQYNLLILDLGLPRLSGMEVLRRLRARKATTPVLVLSAQDSVENRVSALDAGADDYLTKPFALVELLARTRALSRRGTGNSSRIEIGNLSFDQSERVVRIKERIVKFSPRELALIEYLLLRIGRPVRKNQLIDTLCSWSDEVSSNVVDVYFHRLRKKLEPSDVRIVTMRGIGYCLQTQIQHLTRPESITPSTRSASLSMRAA